MRVYVKRLRSRGVVLNRSQRASEPEAQGELFVEERMDSMLKRSVRVARLLSTSDGIKRELLPPLWDVTLVAMAQNGFTLAGFERIGNCRGNADFAQSWWCQQAGRPGR